MTRQFFEECARALGDDGILLANLIGSYEGEKRLVVAGALRSMRAAGLPEALCLPVIQYPWEAPRDFSPQEPRNNIVALSKQPLDLRRNRAGWERLEAFRPFPELPLGRYVTREYSAILQGMGLPLAATVPAEAVDRADPSLAGRLQRRVWGEQYPQHAVLALGGGADLATARTAVRAWAADPALRGLLPGFPLLWDDERLEQLCRIETDWVLAARETWRVSLAAARDTLTHGVESLVGPVDGPERAAAEPTWKIPDAPLFTDERPNADILNR
jgi:hypothetical protein